MSSEPHFSPDGKFIYFIADDDGTQNLCRVPAAGGEITRPIGGRLMLYSYSVAKSGEVAAQITTPDRPERDFHHSWRQAHADHAHQRRTYVAAQTHRTRVREVQEQRRHHRLRLSLQAARLRAGKESIQPFFVLTAVRSGRTTPSSRIWRSSSRPMATWCCIPTRAAPPATDRLTPRPSSPIGATRIFRTTWPWWTTPSRRASSIPTSSASAAGRTAASRPTSSLRRPRVSRPPSQAPARHFLHSMYGHDHYIRDYEYGAGISVERQSGLGQSLTVLQDRKRHHADAVHGRRH